MAIHSSLLGSVIISGKEAKAFRRAMKNPVASPEAVEAVIRGRKLAQEILKKGSVTVKLKPAQKSSSVRKGK